MGEINLGKSKFDLRSSDIFGRVALDELPLGDLPDVPNSSKVGWSSVTGVKVIVYTNK